MTTALANELVSPPIQVSTVQAADTMVVVVRDDYLKGGTKQRAAVPFFNELKHRGVREVIYASPFSGYAQVAIAASAAMVGLQCTIFAEEWKGGMSIYTKSICDSANVMTYQNLDACHIASKQYAKGLNGGFLIPLGLNDQLYKNLLREELAKQWMRLCTEYFIEPPTRLWVPVGSGTLANAFRDALPASTTLVCVDVGVLPPTDDRILKVQSMRNNVYYQTPEKFHQASIHLPPIPSNLYYDAKLWQFVYESAIPNDVWWNVA